MTQGHDRQEFTREQLMALARGEQVCEYTEDLTAEQIQQIEKRLPPRNAHPNVARLQQVLAETGRMAERLQDECNVRGSRIRELEAERDRLRAALEAVYKVTSHTPIGYRGMTAGEIARRALADSTPEGEKP